MHLKISPPEGQKGTIMRRTIQLLNAGVLCAVIALTLAGTAHAQNQAAARGPDQVAVLIAFDRTPGAVEEFIVRSAGGTVKRSFWLVPAIAAWVPETAIEGLRRNPNVTSVDLDGEIHAYDDELDSAWGVKRIGSGIVHAAGNSGAGVKIGIIDSGIDYLHPDLDGNFAGGFDFVNNDNDPMDDNGHGTHVAGTAAGEDDGNGIVGVAPGASLYAYKVLNSAGSGAWSNVIAALEEALLDGIQVTNNSYGSSTNPGGTVQAAFDNSAALGIIHMAAAGNSGNPKGKGNNIGYPARYASVIAVTATDQNDQRASFSSTGNEAELAAPGVGINSAKLGGGYIEFNGTSMASPHAAGAAALVIAAGIADDNGDGNINDEVRDRLNATADDLGEAGRDKLYGFGLVDVAEAADIGPPNDPPSVSLTSPTDGATFNSGDLILFDATASDTEDGNVTGDLVWTSSIDGQIGTGGSFSATLSDGNHTITASVMDSGGKSASSSVDITVGSPPPPPPPGTVSVGSISYVTSGGKNADKHLSVTVGLIDDSGQAVANASVSITLDNTTTGQSWNGAATTGGAGTVTFGLKNAPSGTYVTTVTDVVASGLVWDDVTPPNSFVK